MSLCADCVKGFVHEGTSQGKIDEINGVQAYVTVPEDGGYKKDTVILYIPDIFGLQLPNAQLIADNFARNGFKVIIPDYLNGDFVPADALDPGATFDLGAWSKNHGPAQTRPPLDKIIAGLKAQGVTKFGATGFCFGVRYVFDLAFDNAIDVAVGNHPSLIKVPEDFEKYIAQSKAPLLLNTCTNDTAFPHETQAKADEVFKDFAPGYKREYFEGCTHGFAVRGDLSDPKAKAGLEGAFAASVKWFKTHL